MLIATIWFAVLLPRRNKFREKQKSKVKPNWSHHSFSTCISYGVQVTFQHL